MKKKPVALHEVLKALADRTRLRILALLAAGEICVCHIHTALEVPQPTASRHLAYLKKSGLVEDRKVGLWKHYRLKPMSDAAVQAVVDSAVRAASGTVAVSRDCCRLTEAVRLIRSPLQPESPTPDSPATTR
jgi:ArsR family transcriptional regulator, arsenate/arsenite/antimonite-responsive transcriptional repressor